MLIGALEAGGTKMVCSIGNPQGGVLQRASFPPLTPDVTVPQIVDFIGKFDVTALGIGSFGPLDLNPASPTYGSITKTPKKEWIQYPLMTTLKNALGVPTGIDTDVNAAALAEYTMGAGKGRGSLLYVTVGTGIGGGLVIDGKVVHGLVHPEMGHMLLAPQEGDSMPDGVCPYHRHCLEGLASGPAIEKRWGLSAKLMTEDHPACPPGSARPFWRAWGSAPARSCRSPRPSSASVRAFSRSAARPSAQSKRRAVRKPIASVSASRLRFLWRPVWPSSSLPRRWPPVSRRTRNPPRPRAARSACKASPFPRRAPSF